MAMGLMGLKVGMTQVYDEQGVIHPVTVLKVGPCPVLQVRNQERDGYDALQLGFVDKPRKKAIRAERGHVTSELESKRRKKRTAAGIALAPKPNCEPQRYIKEMRLDAPAPHAVGAVLKVDELFKDIKYVDVIGTSKGRGFQGCVKRHNYGGLRQSHGVKKGARQRGSMASNASNRGSGRPKQGIRMAGQYGNSQVTVRNLTVVRIDAENHLLLVRGAVPGPNGGVVVVRATNKRN